MTQSTQTNGASLEDCHTNFFALTDLCGIRWRVYTGATTSCGGMNGGFGGSGGGDPLEDPVLVSYARCLHADVLCVWRRTGRLVPTRGQPPSPNPGGGGLDAPPSGNPPPSNPPVRSLRESPKELWVFWYGDEPDLSQLVAPELTKGEEIKGSWDLETGLSYECRTLLFKALHNLIERCLLTRDFVRLGRWFVQPYEGPEGTSTNKSTHLSFSLSFFFHGESTVCASVDVRQHPPVRRLQRHHLLLAQQSSQGIPVILGPYGLSGTLTGIGYRISEPSTQKLLQEWRQFFPVETKLPQKESPEASVPAVVEVVVGGHKMRYPSCYVLVTDLDDYLLTSRSGGMVPLGGSSPQSMKGSSLVEGVAISGGQDGSEEPTNSTVKPPPTHNSPFMASTHTLLVPGYLWSGGKNQGAAHQLSERVWQDVVQCPGQQTPQHDGLTPEGALTPAELASQWDFADPAVKINCSCSKLVCVGTPGGGSTSGLQGLQGSGVATPGSVPSLRLTGTNDGAVPSVESPVSVAPSPLPTPMSQPTSVPHNDPMMPTLSPHPPASNQSMGDPTTPATVESHDTKFNVGDLMGPKSVPSVSNQGMSPYPNGERSGNEVSDPSPASSHHHHQQPPQQRGLKRPSLPGKEYQSLLDEDEDDKSSLYDYTKLNAWLHHPVKRFKPAEPKVSEPFWPPYRPSHITERMDIVKSEPEVNGLPAKRIAIKREADPFDFEDDAAALANGPSGGGSIGGSGSAGAVSGSAGGGSSGSGGSSSNNNSGGGNNSSGGGGGSGTGSGGSTSGSAGGAVGSTGSGGGPGGGSGPEGGGSGSTGVKRKEEPEDEATKPVGSVKSSHYPHSPSQTKKTSSLFTSEGLQPSLSDLDEIFESDSPVEESQFPDHTPPSSNKPSGGPEDTAAVKSSSISKSTVANSLPELTTMFPTPPSHEHNPDHETEEATPQLVQVKQEKMELVENYPEQVATSVTVREDQRDWSTVYKPPSVAMFVGSPRYAPLTNLPSQQEQPPVVLPPDCVYKPSWQYNMGEKGPGHMPMGHMGPLPGGPATTGHAVKVNLSPISPAPSSVGGPMSVEGGPGSHRGPGSVGNPPSAGPPMNYELASPVSNQSSYLNKILPSVEPPCASGLGQMHEASSLIVNLVLQDSSINLFRDHNFDSCTMCVCNTRQKVVGNIRGGDGTIYLHPSHLSNDEESITCNCGFSAVVNRRLAYQSGLFYEDEVDLTGLHEALVNERKKQSLLVLLDNKNSDNPDTSILDQLPQTMFELLQSQCLVTLSTTCSVIHRAANVYQKTRQDIVLNMVDYSDGNEMGSFALEQARASCENSDIVSVQPKQSCMHKWTYYQFDGPGCSEDIGRCMKALQPLMQEAIQKKRSKRLWDPVYNVTGPLTWRQFHRMAVRGTEDMAEPLPVPMFLTGHDRDWFSIAPQSVRHWEKMLLEPYSQPRNIAYVVVSPDNEFILNHVRSFFKELSSIYELCKLGRHAPIQKVLRDGIMRVSKTAAAKVANEPLDDWFTLLGDSQISTKLKVYAQVCRHRLAPHLLTLNLDKSLFEVAGAGRNSNSASQVDRQAPSPMPPPSSSGDGLGASSSQSSNTSTTPTESESYTSSTPSGFGPGASLVEQDEDDSPPPAIVVYLVDPFSLGHDHPDMHRLITLGLMRCYKHMLEGLPVQMHSNVYVQVVSLESILELAPENRDRGRQIDQFKTLAFSVFSQCRRSLTHTSNVKSLTGFGPASVYDTFLKPKDPNAEEKKEVPYHMFSPAYILAPIKESRGKLKEAEEALGTPPEKSTVLNCTYCLSEDQRWILAVATDELGELLETVTINIEIPNRTRRKKASARRYGLKKLMEWILSVMSVGVYPWRLVVGRLGRMGHGELKGWSSLLSRKSLIQASKNLKEMCKQCAYLYPGDAPCILSACVVSFEPDSALRMMPDVFTPDERFGQNSQNCTLSTPQDVSCTHILVFPTSATTQSAQRQFQDENFHLNGDDLLSMMTEDFDPTSMGDIGMGLNISDILGLDTGPIQDDQMDDIRGRQDSQSQPGSPTSGVSGCTSPSQFSGQAKSNGVVMVDPSEDASAQVLQQPLALGYYVSTASTGRLPRWFWSACPHLETSCPAFLKSALHLHSPAITQSEDLMHSTNNKVHALDSSLTTDVLRYVLEGYNSLSWLVLDPATQDRRSCLPLHMQVLSHLYNVMAALV